MPLVIHVGLSSIFQRGKRYNLPEIQCEFALCPIRTTPNLPVTCSEQHIVMSTPDSYPLLSVFLKSEVLNINIPKKLHVKQHSQHPAFTFRQFLNQLNSAFRIRGRCCEGPLKMSSPGISRRLKSRGRTPKNLEFLLKV